ncbi:MAG: hypothetical protein JXM70_24340 [Pirellulales bacterium]|nr:hypothetical protein [Pirellulales bacterium]
MLLICALIGCSTKKSISPESIPKDRQVNLAQKGSLPSEPVLTTPEAIIHRAIDAHGGKNTIRQITKGHIQSTLNTLGRPTRFDLHFQLPDKLSQICQDNIEGRERRIRVLAVNEETWSITNDENVSPINVPPKVLVKNIYPLSFLKDLLRLETTECTLLPPQKDDKKTMVGIQLQDEYGNNSFYFFDKKHGYLRVIETEYPVLRKSNNPLSLPAKRIDKKTFSDFKQIEKLVIPMQEVTSSNGKVSSRFLLEHFELLDTIPKDTFAIPSNITFRKKDNNDSK